MITELGSGSYESGQAEFCAGINACSEREYEQKTDHSCVISPCDHRNDVSGFLISGEGVGELAGMVPGIVDLLDHLGRDFPLFNDRERRYC